MKKRWLFILAVLMIAATMFVACNSEVTDAGASAQPGKELVYATFGGGSKALITEYSFIDYTQLYWFYQAEKKDSYGTTGAVTGTAWAKVPGDANRKGLDGTVGPFSQGLWAFKLRGYETEYSENPGEGKYDVSVVIGGHTYYYSGLVYSGESTGTGTGKNEVNLKYGNSNAIPVTVAPAGTTGKIALGTSTEPLAYTWYQNQGGEGALKLKVTVTRQIVNNNNSSTESWDIYYDFNSSYKYSGYIYTDGSEPSTDLPTGNYNLEFTVCAIIDNDVAYEFAKQSLSLTVFGSQTTTITGSLVEGLFVENAHFVATDVASSIVIAAPETKSDFAVDKTPVGTVVKGTSVSIPAGELTSGTQNNMTIEVVSMDIAQDVASMVNFAIVTPTEETANIAVAAIDITLKQVTTTTDSSTGDVTVEEASVKNFTQPVTITTYISPNLNGVKVLYNVQEDDLDKSQPVAGTGTDKTVADILTDETKGTGLGYHPASGLLRFQTTHFSQFFVVSDSEAQNVTTGVFYSTLKEAIEKAESDQTIKVLKDIKLNDIIVIDKSLMLNLDGHTVENYVTDSMSKSVYNIVLGGRAFIIYNDAELTVNANNGKMIIPEENANSWGFFRVLDGVLTLNGGEYSGNTNNGTFFHAYAGYGAQIYLNDVTATTNYRFLSSNAQVFGKIVVEGGTYTQGNDSLVSTGGTIPAFHLDYMDATFKDVIITSYIGSCVSVHGSYLDLIPPYNTKETGFYSKFYGNNIFKVLNPNNIQSWNATPIGVEANGVVEIHDGEYYGPENGSGYGVYIFTSDGHVEVYGGEFIAETAVRVDHNDSYYSDTPSIDIYGGIFKGSLNKGNNTRLEITGGEFDNDPTAYVAPGFEAVEIEAGAKWKVQPKSVDSSDVSVTKGTTTGYMKLSEFRDSVNSGYSFDTVELLKDITIDLKDYHDWNANTKEHYFFKSFDGTFDGRNKKITITNTDGINPITDIGASYSFAIFKSASGVLKDLVIENKTDYVLPIVHGEHQDEKKVTFSNVDYGFEGVTGTLYFKNKNTGCYITYSSGPVDFIDCDNYYDLEDALIGETHGIFVGGYPKPVNNVVYEVKFINCSNYGDIFADRFGLLFGNVQYTNYDTATLYCTISISDFRNYGEVKVSTGVGLFGHCNVEIDISYIGKDKVYKLTDANLGIWHDKLGAGKGTRLLITPASASKNPSFYELSFNEQIKYQNTGTDNTRTEVGITVKLRIESSNLLSGTPVTINTDKTAYDLGFKWYGGFITKRGWSARNANPSSQYGWTDASALDVSSNWHDGDDGIKFLLDNTNGYVVIDFAEYWNTYKTSQGLSPSDDYIDFATGIANIKIFAYDENNTLFACDSIPANGADETHLVTTN